MTDRIAMLLAHKGFAVQCATSTTSVAIAVRRMNDQRIGSLVIVEYGRVVGILTKRDVLERVVARMLHPSVTLVRDVMTPDPVAVYPQTTVSEAQAIVSERRCRHLPVVDGASLCGLISAGDLTAWMVRSQQRTIVDLEGFIRAA